MNNHDYVFGRNNKLNISTEAATASQLSQQPNTTTNYTTSENVVRQAVSGGNAILGALNNVSGALTTLAVLAGAGGYIYNKIKDTSKHLTSNSYLDVTQILTVEPLSIISKDLVTSDILPDLNQLSLNIFCSYYLQAVDALNKIKYVEVIKTLDALNPNRTSAGFLNSNKTSKLFSNESASIDTYLKDNYKYKLPKNNSSVSVEGMGDSKSSSGNDLSTPANLFVGKNLNLEIEVPDGTNKKGFITVKVPITVRMQSMTAAPSTVSAILLQEYNSFTNKLRDFGSGIKDLLFAQNIIDNKKKIMASKDGQVLREIAKRSAKAKGFGLLTNNPSMAEVTNTYIISESVVKEIETKLGGRLTDPLVREKIFEESMAMIVLAVDRNYERVNLYVKGSATHSELSFKEVKSKVKENKGSDIVDVMRALIQGNGVGF